MLKLLREFIWIAAFVALWKGEFVLCYALMIATWRVDVALGEAR